MDETNLMRNIFANALNQDGSPVEITNLDGRYIGLYFAADWTKGKIFTDDAARCSKLNTDIDKQNEEIMKANARITDKSKHKKLLKHVAPIFAPKLFQACIKFTPKLAERYNSVNSITRAGRISRTLFRFRQAN